ncbi:MAG: glycosyltransferase family 9 protein [Leptolyngbya sp. Prado105]|jgi:ADP-heptose:LPS heptosyltransferase|nr:glycosyltransferase family 9 protein [Leptolyngbya sp. Prado105]
MKKILFIELLGGIGDLVIALSAIHALARAHSQAHMTVLTFSPGDSLLTLDPLVDSVICAPKGQARQAVENLLAQETFDLIISDTTYGGIAEILQNYPAITNLWRSPPDNQLVSQRFLEILLAENVIHEMPKSEIYLSPTERAIARKKLGALYRPLIFLCTEAGMKIKRWSAGRFIELGRALNERYQGTIIVPVGEDLAQAEQIVSGIGGTAQLWQRGSLRELASVLAEADFAIANDTGLAHMAAALNVPTITLFGPSWAGRYGHVAPHRDLQAFPECPKRIIQNFTEQCCWYSGECPYEWDSCMEAILPADVLAAIPEMPAKSGMSADAQNNDRLLLEWQSVRNLLVMRLDNIGDVIMTSPALKALRENLPESKITLMTSPSGALTAPLLPWVDEILPWRVLWQDLGALSFDPDREWKLIERLKEFDAVIILTSFSQSPHPAGLLCALAGISLRLGESKEQDFGTLTHSISALPDSVHQVDRNLALIESIGVKVLDRHLALKIPEPPPILPDYILLNPWTSCQSRNYSLDRFADAALTLAEKTGYPIVVTGVEKDRPKAQALLAKLGDRAIDQIGKTTLAELTNLIANAKLVLTNNTSVMHIADATETPQVVLFAGTEQESQWQPRRSNHRLLRRPTVCSPCYLMTCPYTLQCLDIPASAIVEASLELL